MLGQAVAFILALALLRHPLVAGITSAVTLGVGTAMVYPALIAAVGDHAHPSWRTNALGTYPFWRDVGYAAGALIAGVVADLAGLNIAVLAAAVLTAAAGLLAAGWMGTDTPPQPRTNGRRFDRTAHTARSQQRPVPAANPPHPSWVARGLMLPTG